MVYSKKFILNECAVSEVLGMMLMTIIVIIMMTSIGMCVLSEPRPPDAPHIDISEQFEPFNDTIVIRNNGGEPVSLLDFKLVLQMGSTKYVINGEELSGQLIEENGDNGFWDLGEYISVKVSEVCGLDLENRDEDLTVFFIHTPSKKVIQKSFIPSIYLDDEIPEDEYEEGYVWIPPQLIAFDNSVLLQNSNNKHGLLGSANLDDVRTIGGGFTTYYPNEDASTYEYFEFGLNEPVLDSFEVTFSDYENLNISGVKIKVVYEKHDNSFPWGKLKVWDQTNGTSCEHDLFNKTKGFKTHTLHRIKYVEEEFDLPYITTAEDLENLNVTILVQANNGNSDQHYLHIDYVAVGIPCSVKISPAPVFPQGNLIHIGNVSVTTSNHGSDVTATAVVTILDNNNNPVNGATVSGSWSGATTGTNSSVTGATGTVTVYSNEVKHTGNNALTFTFNVSNVTHSSYTWDQNPKAGTAVYS